MSKSLKKKNRPVIVTTSWDDGHILDLKLAKLLKHHGVAGTFYIAPQNHELAEEQRLRADQVTFLAQDFEIGAHTVTHKRLPTLSDKDARHEIFDSKKQLEKMLGKPVTSFCYPAGKYKKKHAVMVKEAGFTLGRTVKRFIYNTKGDSHTLGTSVHTYDHWLDIWHVAVFARFNPFVFFKLYRKWDALAIAMFDRVLESGGVFHLWGHSWEVDEHGDWERLEQVLKYIARREGVSYVTNSKIV